MKEIIVIGYPKSGCTWATRLVAELVGCPVAGFWLSDKEEIATEGQERISDYRCFKSHHQLSELGISPNHSEKRLIYILRDLNVRSVRLMSNNPRKREALIEHGIEVAEQVPLLIQPCESNITYLRTKRERLDHHLPHLDAVAHLS